MRTGQLGQLVQLPRGANERSGGLLLVWGRVEGDVVEQGGDEGEEQEGQRQYEDHADHHQGENGVVGPHQGQPGRQADEDHQQPDDDLGVDVPKGEGATELIGLRELHGGSAGVLPQLRKVRSPWAKKSTSILKTAS